MVTHCVPIASARGSLASQNPSFLIHEVECLTDVGVDGFKTDVRDNLDWVREKGIASNPPFRGERPCHYGRKNDPLLV